MLTEYVYLVMVQDEVVAVYRDEVNAQTDSDSRGGGSYIMRMVLF